MGGDEINIIEKGKNYGWPVVSYGVNYDGSPVGTGKQHHAGMIDPVWHWTPSIAPSGMAFYTGDLFPQWKGSLFNGALKYESLSRLELKDGKPVKETVSSWSAENHAFLKVWLPALQAHLESKGLLAVYRQHIFDEPVDANRSQYLELAKTGSSKMC